jgi:hypothetical protein
MKDAPASFGTTEFPQVMRKELLPALSKLHDEASMSSTPDATRYIASAAGKRSFADLCNACSCCIERVDSITVGPSAKPPALEAFQVLRK